MTHTPSFRAVEGAKRAHDEEDCLEAEISKKKAHAGGQGPHVNLSSAGLSGKQPVPAL